MYIEKYNEAEVRNVLGSYFLQRNDSEMKCKRDTTFLFLNLQFSYCIISNFLFGTVNEHMSDR